MGWHQSLIDYMQALGYQADKNGVCFGYAHMGIQAILSDGMIKFDQRVGSMMDDYENLKEGNNEFTVSERGQIGITPFLDGVELYYQAVKHQELFNKETMPNGQDALATAPLVMSTEMRNQGGLARCAEFVGVYNDQELTQYFATLQNILTNSPNLKPLAMSFGNGEHSIAVGYDPSQDQWIFIDANHMPTEYYDSPQEIAAAVQKGFGATDDKTVTMASKIYTTNQNIQSIEPLISEWRSNTAFKDMHKTDKESPDITSSHLNTLLRVAAKDGNTEVVRDLLKRADIDPNQMAQNGGFPLYFAGALGRLETVKELLKHPNIDVNQVSTTGISTFQAAVDLGKIEVVKALLSHPKFDQDQLNKPDLNGNTPLHLAVMKGDLEMVKVLIEHGADVNLENNEGETPGFVAAMNDSTDIVDVIADHMDKMKQKAQTPAPMEVLEQSPKSPTMLNMFANHKQQHQKLSTAKDDKMDVDAQSPRIRVK